MVAAELGLPHDLVTVDITRCENYDPSYAKNINPGMVVPTYVDLDGHTVLQNSKVIVETIVEQYTGNFNDTDLRPPLDQEATSEEWLKRMDRLDTETVAMGSGKCIPRFLSVLRYKKAIRLTKKYSEQHAAVDPSLAILYRTRHNLLRKKLRKIKSRNEYKYALDCFRANLKDMDDLLSDGRVWLCGDRFSLADAIWAPFFCLLDEIGFTEDFLSQLHFVQRYASNLKKRDSYETAILDFPSPIDSTSKKAQVACSYMCDRLVGGKAKLTKVAATSIGAIALLLSLIGL